MGVRTVWISQPRRPPVPHQAPFSELSGIGSEGVTTASCTSIELGDNFLPAQSIALVIPGKESHRFHPR